MSALRRARVNAGLEIEELGELSEISPDQIRNIENGRTKNPRARTLVALAKPLKVSPAEIDPKLERVG